MNTWFASLLSVLVGALGAGAPDAHLPGAEGRPAEAGSAVSHCPAYDELTWGCRLEVSVRGSGFVSGEAPFFKYDGPCASRCTWIVMESGHVTLSATPADGWKFEGWGGDCPGSCLMSGHKSVSATFSDAAPPTTPSGLRVVSATPTELGIAWERSSDNGDVAGYEVFLMAERVATVGDTSYVHRGLECDKTYRLGVRARDGAGNVSSTAWTSSRTAKCETADRTPPSTPAGLAVASTSATSIGLSWNAATDDVGVTGYEVLVNDAHVATVEGTSNLFAGLVCGTEYGLGVRARDAAGNVSETATTRASTARCADATAPSTPGGLNVTSADATSIAVAWTASTDNVGVTGYDVLVDGIGVGTVSTLSHTFTGLACGTAFTLGVRARDGAGNASAPATVPAATAACVVPQVTPLIGEANEPVGRDELPRPARDLLVSIGGSGTGTVIGSPVGRALLATNGPPVRIVCGTAGFRCFTRAPSGTAVRLTARPLRGFVFKGWTGACAGSGPTCRLTLSSSRSVKALFAARKARSKYAVALERPRFSVRWVGGVGRGALVVRGRVGVPSVLRIQLRRPGGGPLVTQVVSVLAGRFRVSPKLAPGLLPPGALVLPGGFVVSVRGRSGRTALPLQLQTVALAAPPEGVVRRAFASPAEDGRPARALPAGSREAWARFDFEAQPRAGSRLVVRWYWPDGRFLGEVRKPNRPGVASYLRSASGIPSGLWRAELRARGRLVKALSVRVG